MRMTQEEIEVIEARNAENLAKLKEWEEKEGIKREEVKKNNYNDDSNNSNMWIILGLLGFMLLFFIPGEAIGYFIAIVLFILPFWFFIKLIKYIGKGSGNYSKEEHDEWLAWKTVTKR